MNRLLWCSLCFFSFFFIACSHTGVRTDTLESRTWALVAYAEDGKTQRVEDASTQLQFADGTLSGSTGCNQIGGRYELHNSRLRTEGVYTTKMACPQMMEREASLTRVLNGGPTLALVNEDLLMSFSGTVLTFRAVSNGGEAEEI